MHEPAYKNFLSLPPEQSDYATARYAVLPVPYEGTVSWEIGTAKGPAAIIAASRYVEKLDEEFLAEFVSPGIATCAPVRAASRPDEMMRRVRRRASEILQDGKFLIALGGEHSISAPLVEAAAEVHGRISVLQIDAHGDLRQMLGRTIHSHGAVMRRILEIVPGICQVGIRSFSKEELDDCPTQVRNFITPQRVRTDPRWLDAVLELLPGKVYITIDVDGLDPAFAPGTGTPEPGGLDYHEVTRLLAHVCGQRHVIGADIVEVRPLGENRQTEYLAARLAYKIITYSQVCGLTARMLGRPRRRTKKNGQGRTE